MIILVAVLLVIILLVSFFVVHSASKPSTSATPSPPPSQTPTSTGTTSPLPSHIPTPTPVGQTPPPTPTPTPYLYPGEVTQYQGQTLTPISGFLNDLVLHPDVAIYGTQYLNQATYSLTVDGLVNNTSVYTYNDVINNFQSYQQVGTLLCVEDWSVTMLWQGVLVNDLINKAGVSPQATVVIFHCADGYTTALPLTYIVQNNIMIAYKMNNVTLPAQLGWPFTVVAQNQYGYKWANWVTEIEVSSDTGYLGYWESQGYPNDATVP